MNETNVEVEHDIKLVNFLVNKFMKKYNVSFKKYDEMCSLCFLKLYKNKNLYDSSRGKYSTFVSSVVNSTFLQDFKNNRTQKILMQDSVKSLDSVITGTEDFTLLEVVEDKNFNIDSGINYEVIKNLCLKVIERMKGKNKEICNLIIQEIKDAEISKKVKVSREYVRQIRNKFLLLVYCELKKNDIDLNYKFDLNKMNLSNKFKKQIEDYVK